METVRNCCTCTTKQNYP